MSEQAKLTADQADYLEAEFEASKESNSRAINMLVFVGVPFLVSVGAVLLNENFVPEFSFITISIAAGLFVTMLVILLHGQIKEQEETQRLFFEKCTERQISKADAIYLFEEVSDWRRKDKKRKGISD